MVTYDKNEKDLVIPSALGLAGMQDSVCGVTEQEVIEIVESAITDYDTEIQVDLEDIRENVSGNTDDIAALSAATVALEQRVDNISTSALTEQIEALSGSVEDIRSDVETLSGDTDNIRSDVAALSAVTSGIAIDVETAFKSEIGLRSDLTSLSGRTSAITVQVSELSATTSGIAIDVATLSGSTVAVEQAVAGKQDTLTAGDGIDISGATISVKAGEGLGFSGDTLVVSGISGLEDIPHYVYLSTGSGQTDLYDDIVEAYDAGKKVIMEAIDVEDRSNNGRKVYLDLTKVLTATTTAGTVVYASFIFSGEGQPNTGNGLRIFKVTVNRIGYGDVSGTQTANNIYYASKKEIISNYTLPNASSSKLGGIKIGSGVTMSGDFLSVKYGDGLGMSGDTLVVSGGTGGGGIEKVSTLPLTAEEGDVVWLEGHAQSGYTITMDMSEKSFESGYIMAEINWNNYECEAGVNYGVWQYNAEYGAKLRSRRNGSTRYLDIITDNNVSLGQDANSMQTGVEFPFLGKFYAYEGGKWHNIAREVYVDFDKEPDKAKEYFLEIYSGLTDFDGSDLVIFYRQDSDVRTYAAFKPYFSAHYGMDCQSNDSRGARDSSWGQIRVDMNRLSYDWEQDSISFNTLVGTKWSATEDQLSGTMCVYVGPNGDMGHRDVNCLFDEASQHQLAVKGCELDFSAEYGFGSVVYARKHSINDESWYYTWSLIVPTDTDVKKGVWHATDLGDMSSYVLDSWTTL